MSIHKYVHYTTFNKPLHSMSRLEFLVLQVYCSLDLVEETFIRTNHISTCYNQLVVEISRADI